MCNVAYACLTVGMARSKADTMTTALERITSDSTPPTTTAIIPPTSYSMESQAALWAESSGSGWGGGGGGEGGGGGGGGEGGGGRWKVCGKYVSYFFGMYCYTQYILCVGGGGLLNELNHHASSQEYIIYKSYVHKHC